jgi:hypothetical protein
MQLIRSGKATTRIRISAHASIVERFAARELARYVRKISGATLSVNSKEAGPAVYVGKATGQQLRGMKTESFRILADRSSLRILGADDRGTLYGVYTLIHDYLGVCWVDFHEKEETIPAKKSIRIPDIERYEEPYLSIRRHQISADPRTAEGRDYFAWAAKNRHNTVAIGGEEEAAKAQEEAAKRGLDVVIGGHDFGGWMPEEKYFKSHPEYFALIDGKRQPLSICATNPDVVDLHANKILEFNARYPGIKVMGFWAYDNYHWCECKGCTAVEPVAWYSEVNPNAVAGRPRMHTYRYLKFCNEVISRVAAKRPDVRFELIAYWATVEVPPKLDFEIHPNANVMVAMIERMYDRPLNHKLTKQEAKGLTEELHDPWDRKKYGHYPPLLRKWRKAFGGPIYFYEYYTASLGCLACLFPMMYTIREDSRFYKKIGTQGFGTQGWLHNWPSYRVGYWYATAAAWDGKLSHDQILKQYCWEYFGKAGDEVFHIYRTLEKSFAKHRMGLPLRQMVQAFDSKTMETCAAHMAKATRRARDERTSARLQQFGALLEYGRLLHLCCVSGRQALKAMKGGDRAGSYRALGEQMGLQEDVLQLMKGQDLFKEWDHDRIHHYFAGRGSFWVRNEWGMYHLFKELEPLGPGI